MKKFLLTTFLLVFCLSVNAEEQKSLTEKPKLQTTIQKNNQKNNDNPKKIRKKYFKQLKKENKLLKKKSKCQKELYINTLHLKQKASNWNTLKIRKQ